MTTPATPAATIGKRPDPSLKPIRKESNDRMRRVLVLSVPFPTRTQPQFGVFVKERVRALAALPGYQVRVVAPVPYFPPWKRFRWYSWSQFPRSEVIDGLEVRRPRYPLVPKLGGYFHAELMWPAVKREVDRLRREDGFDFDLLDAHYVYPMGAVAARLGKRHGKPVVLTGRGEDVARFPELPRIGRVIRRTLAEINGCVGVSREIADRCRELGAREPQVIPNGVDPNRFYPMDRVEVRRRLGLPAGPRIIMSAGCYFENKGHHLLVDALAALVERGLDVHLVIVGGVPSWGESSLPEIEQRIRAHGLHERVHLPGRQPHEQMVHWYNAADLFALLSQREGSPNVVQEALACGVPVVATPVGGIPQALAEPGLGHLLPDRSPASIVDGLQHALQTDWDRDAIRCHMEHQGWDRVAARLDELYSRVLLGRAKDSREFPSEESRLVCGPTAERALPEGQPGSATGSLASPVPSPDDHAG